MINVLREECTEFLYPEFLDKELRKYEFPEEITLAIEPRQSEFYFCQDYSFPIEMHPKFVFYVLPSWRNDHVKKMGKNCALVTYAADPKFHKPQPLPKVFDVGFVGKRYYPERNNYLETIAKFYPRSFFNQDTLPGEKIPEMLSQCKVLFNHTRPDIDVNLRFFEEMALGCQVMLRNDWLKEFAVEGVHYLGYSSPEEALEVIKTLLENDDLREKITYNARAHFLSNHTYAHRAQAIINHLTEYFNL